MRPGVVVDTNVAVVANGGTEQAGPACVAACVRRLRRVREDETLLLDEPGAIFGEYRRNLQPVGQPRAGHRFFKWLAQNRNNEDRCRQVPVTPHGERGFAEFPDSEDLRDFDRDDRAFVAVAIASGMGPPVVNASDTDWWNHREALARHGVEIEFLCPELMPAGTPPGRRRSDRTG